MARHPLAMLRALHQHPVRVVQAGGALTIVLLALLVWVALGVAELSRANARALTIQQRDNRLMVLNQAMNRSVRMALQTGDRGWEEQYRLVEPTVSEAARSLLDAAAQETAATAVRVREAGDAVTEVEREVLALIRRGEPDSARRLLSGEAYGRQRHRLRESLNQLLRASAAAAGESGAVLASRLRWAGAMIVVILVALAATWRATLGLLRRHLSERDQVKAAVREGERRFQGIVENMREAFWMVDPREGRILYLSPAWERVWGIPVEAALASPDVFFDSVHPDDRDRVVAAVQASETEGFDEIYRIVRPDGELRWIHGRGQAVPWEDEAGVRLVGLAEDITEQHQLREAGKRREARFRALIENGRDLITLLDADGIIRFESPSVTAALGYDPAELVGRHMLEFVHPDDVPAMQTAFAEVVRQTRQALGIQCRFRHKDGSWRVLEARGANLLADPSVKGIVVNSRDVTDRHRAEEALAESRERFRLMVEGSEQIFFYEQDAQGHFTYLSPSIERVLGYPPSELLDKRPGALFQSREAKPHGAEAAARVDGTRSIHIARLRHRNGKIVPVEVVESPIGDGSEGVRGFARDISERLEAEERARRMVLEQVAREEAERLQRRIQSILESITDAFFVVDPQWRFTYVNNQAEKLLGRPRGEILGRSLWEVAPTEEDRQFASDYHRAMREQVAVDFEEHSRETGRWTQVRAYPHESGLAIYKRDITARKTAEEGLRRAKEEAEAANRAKSEFLGRMSHELRTPMNAILGFSQLLELEDLNEENRESVQQILRAGRHLLSLIDEVLDIARIEAGQMRFSAEPVHAGEVVDEVLALVRPLAAARGVRLPPRASSVCEGHVMADQQRLKQVLLNLFSNAIKYNREGGAVELACEAGSEGMQRLVVSDTGLGIASEKLDRLFSPFERIGAEQSSIQGTGLGLALSRALVEAMGGRIGVESEPGHGSRFWIELPRVEGQLERYARESGVADAEHDSAFGDGTVLYVEDNLSNLRLVERILARRPGYVLVPAMQGRIALELAREHRPGLILLDVNLPDCSGSEVLRHLRDDPLTQEIPVVIVSADATPDQVRRLQEQGAQEYLTKPFNVQMFLSIVDRHLRPDG